jgi:hypothetical protein
MKTLTTLSLILISTFSFSQNPNGWIQQGAQFYHAFQELVPNTANGYLRYYLDEEIEINGMMLQRMKGEIHAQDQVAAGQWVDNGLVPLSGSILFHTSNDSVYLSDEDGNLRFAWHLNPQVGDVWDFGPYSLFNSTGTMNAHAIVTLLENVTINGVASKDITVVPCIDVLGTPVPENQTESYMVGYHLLGKINTILGPYQNFPDMGFYEVSPQTSYCPTRFSNVTCFLSSEIDLYQLPGISSCTGNIAILENQNLVNYAFFHNPTSSTFTITNPEQINNLQIFDAQGRLQAQNVNLPFDVRGFSAGMYWVRCETLDGGVFVEKLVVE